MNITLNGKNISLQTTTPVNVKQLLQQQNISMNGIAVAVNQQVIPKSGWENTFIQENDKIIIITATQGG